MTLQDSPKRSGDMLRYVFLFVSKSHEKQNKTSQTMNSSHSQVLFVQPQTDTLSYSSVPKLNCCPKAMKHTSMSHTVALTNMSLHYNEQGHCGLFRVYYTYTIPLLKTVPNKCTKYSCSSNVLASYKNKNIFTTSF